MTCILYHIYPNNFFTNKYFMYTFMMTPLTTQQYKAYHFHLYVHSSQADMVVQYSTLCLVNCLMGPL